MEIVYLLFGTAGLCALLVVGFALTARRTRDADQAVLVWLGAAAFFVAGVFAVDAAVRRYDHLGLVQGADGLWRKPATKP